MHPKTVTHNITSGIPLIRAHNCVLVNVEKVDLGQGKTMPPLKKLIVFPVTWDECAPMVVNGCLLRKNINTEIIQSTLKIMVTSTHFEKKVLSAAQIYINNVLGQADQIHYMDGMH
jgi:hypothetical protein